MTPRVDLLNGTFLDQLGFIPMFLREDDPRPAREQFDERYAHGGGWSPMPGWTLRDDDSLKYPGDPPFRPLARIKLRGETVVIYECAWVAIIQPDRTFEVSRMD